MSVARKRAEDAPRRPVGRADVDGLASRLLARRPAERPTAERVFEALGVTAPPGPERAEVFVGRGRARVSRGALRVRADGRPRAVEIVGPSGIGKTSLVRQFIARLSAGRPHRVFSSFCYENEHGAFRALDAIMTALLGDSERGSMDGAIGSVLAEELRALGRDRPLVVFVDQLQWADADSARVLTDAWPLLDEARVLLLLCLRDDQRAQSPFVRHVEAHYPSLLETKLPVGALAPDECADLVQRLGGRPDVCVDAAGGNPMILARMIEGAQSLLALDDDSRELGAWLALAGHPIELHTLARAAENVRDAVGAAQRLESQRWIGKTAHRGAVMLAPAHDWMRDRLEQSVDRARTRAMHMAPGRALPPSGAPPEEAGDHFHRARA